jgi:large subunit ribosomal protein L21
VEALASNPAPAENKPDNLQLIEGIGPKIAQLLRQAGIQNFRQLSEESVDGLKRVLAAAGSRYKMHDPTSWIEQAKLAAEGKWEELKTLQEELNKGV